jgi:hypothetical protein
VCIGPKTEIEKVLGERDIYELFGGFVVYHEEASGADFIGVWGARKAARFRQILLRRGAKYTLRKGFLPSLHERRRAIRQ